MNYSICFLDKEGRTTRSEFTPFDSDAAVLAHARGELPANAIVEIWKGENLLKRLVRDTPALALH